MYEFAPKLPLSGTMRRGTPWPRKVTAIRSTGTPSRCTPAAASCVAVTRWKPACSTQSLPAFDEAVLRASALSWAMAFAVSSQRKRSAELSMPKFAPTSNGPCTARAPLLE